MAEEKLAQASSSNTRWSDAKGWLSALVLCAASLYLWLLPLFKPRGVYLWGYYSLPGIYAGIPIGTFTLVVLITMFSPRSIRRRRSVSLTAIALVGLFAFFSVDFAYAVLVGKLLRPEPCDYWMDGIATASAGNLPDLELGFIRKPNIQWKGTIDGKSIVTYGTDENGFRNPPGITMADVVFVGDSYTEGANVRADETFVVRAGAATGLKVVNLGRGWHGPQQELGIMRRYAFNYRPKAIVWAVFEGNDLDEAIMYKRWKQNMLGSKSIFQRFSHRSILARFLPVRWENKKDIVRPLRQPDGSTIPAILDYPYVPDAAISKAEGWDEERRCLDEGIRECKSRKIDLLVLFLPVKSRILDPYIEYRSPADREQWVPGGKCDRELDFGTAVKLLCLRLECPFIDATQALRDRAAIKNRDLYTLNGDNHISVGGHAVVGELVAGWLKSQDFAKSEKAASNRP